MNIFILDRNPHEAARLQCDKHVVKMIVESAQMLSTAHRDDPASEVRGRARFSWESESTLLRYRRADGCHARELCWLSVGASGLGER